MSPCQHKELQELSLIFSQGNATIKQVKQLSELLSEINRSFNQPQNQEFYISEPY